MRSILDIQLMISWCCLIMVKILLCYCCCRCSYCMIAVAMATPKLRLPQSVVTEGHNNKLWRQKAINSFFLTSKVVWSLATTNCDDRRTQMAPFWVVKLIWVDMSWQETGHPDCVGNKIVTSASANVKVRWQTDDDTTLTTRLNYLYDDVFCL